MLMKRNKWILYIDGVLLSVFAACSADSPMEMVQDDGRVEIRINSNIASSVEAATRAVLDGMINSGFGTDLDVAFARADADNSGTYTAYGTDAPAGSIAASSKELSFAPAQYYRANGNKTKLIGWYPRRTGVSFTQATGVVDFGTIDGKTDIMATPLKEGKKDAPIQSLAFSHLLTQLSVKVYAPDAATQALWGKVKSIKVTGKKQGCTFKVPAVTSADGTTITDLSFTGTDNLDLVSADPVTPSSTIAYPLEMGVGATADDAVMAGYAMFAPQTADAIELQVDLVAGGLQKPKISVPADGGFKAGTSYAITLKFTSAGINPTVSVTDWVSGDPIEDVEI